MVLFIVIFVFLAGCAPPPAIAPGVTVQETMGRFVEGFAQVTSPKKWSFPDDHGPHNQYRSEWWYFTGNLDGPANRRFGYQFTIFRQGISAKPMAVTSMFQSNEIYMLHLVLTDIDSGKFYAYENFARADQLGLAGATSQAVWIDATRLEIKDSHWTLQGVGEGFEIKLKLAQLAPIIFQGEGGYSRKGESLENASHYYTMPKWETTGEVCIAKDCLSVSGLSWLDREFSSSALDENQVGWDWFAMQLQDGTNIMLYQMRRSDGSIDPHSHGSYQANGQSKSLTAEDFELIPIRFAQQSSGKKVPVQWDIRVLDQVYSAEALVEDHELPFSISYWEGPIDIACESASCGRGYLEMTGYNN